MSNRTLAIARATGVIGATVALVTGITFANLSSTATLSNNNISSASAGLTVFDGSNFVSNAPGFSVTGLIPGTGTAFLPFYLKDSDADLALTVQVPTAPTATGFTGWENLHVTFQNNHTGATFQTDMAALLAGPVSLDTLPANSQGDGGNPAAVGNYSVKFDIDPASTFGSQATVSNFDFNFTGTEVTP